MSTAGAPSMAARKAAPGRAARPYRKTLAAQYTAATVKDRRAGGIEAADQRTTKNTAGKKICPECAHTGSGFCALGGVYCRSFAGRAQDPTPGAGQQITTAADRVAGYPDRA